MLLKGKTAIVTGAARGIGLATAEHLAREGVNVILSDIDEDGGARAEKELIEAGWKARFFAANIAERLDVFNLVALAIENFGQIDILINNAATLDDAPFLDLSIEEFDRVLSVNLRGTFLVGQAVARQMARQIEDGGAPGAIVNMSSVNAVFALPDHVAYSISKGGVAQLTKAMAISLAPLGIRVNAIGPGSIMTPMLADVVKDEEIRARILSRTPLGRFGRPDEIAAIAVFLVSEAASYITGETIFADGGRLPLNYTMENS